MNYMKDILKEIKLRPSMYITDCKLSNLHALINGYMYCFFQEQDAIPEFYPGFQEYITERYHVTTGQHWEKILIYYSNSEREAVNKFFQHLEEYTKIEEAHSE